MSKPIMILAFGLIALVLGVQLFRIQSVNSDTAADCAKAQTAYMQQVTTAYAKIPATSPEQKAALEKQMQTDLAKKVCEEHVDNRSYGEKSMAAWTTEHSAKNTAKSFFKRLFR